MLEGKTVNLRVMEKEDVDFVVRLRNDIDSHPYVSVKQLSKTETMKEFDNPTTLAVMTERKQFIIEKKDGTRIGSIRHSLVLPSGHVEIGYFITASERGKGYASEAVQMMVDYLFLSRDIVRVQAWTDVGNVASKKVLERAGFNKEGTIRKSFFNRGEWRDAYLYSILREEWKEPRILTKAH